jgi:hypothetical protein
MIGFNKIEPSVVERIPYVRAISVCILFSVTEV